MHGVLFCGYAGWSPHGFMARSVVLKGVTRCPQCRQALRWCICSGQHEVACPIDIDVLMHYQEAARPTSTGHLIKRLIPASKQHVYRKDLPLDRLAIQRPGKTLWVLHPSGEPLLPEMSAGDAQILLLDGNWDQAGEMMKQVEGWGQRISLPMKGDSRYWLRAQQGVGKFSTMEALIFLLKALGQTDVHAQLSLQLELHVYAGLLGRGRKAMAEDYLRESPLRAAMPELLAKLAPKPRING